MQHGLERLSMKKHVACGQTSEALDVEIASRISVQKVIIAAEQAGAAILKIYAEKDDWDVQFKSDNSPVTKADSAANKVICDALAKHWPHIPIISEESKQVPYEQRKDFQTYWCVDPLDGTKEFLKRNGEFTVNIALIHEHEPIMGVVHAPCLQKTYWAMKDAGAFVKEEGHQRRIRVSEFRLTDSKLRIVCSASHNNNAQDEFLAMFHEPQLKNLGSSLKLAMVAEGQADIYPRMVPTQEWDTAAADVIVREAGGLVLQAGKCTADGKPQEDWKTILAKEQPLVYNKENLLNPFFVVYGIRRDVDINRA